MDNLPLSRASLWSLKKVEEMNKSVKEVEEFLPSEKRQKPVEEKAPTKGMPLLKKLMNTLNMLDEIKDANGNPKYKRTDSQMRCHKEFLVALCKLIFKDELVRYTAILTEMFDLKERGLRSECVIITPRRWGKTWSVAMFCAVLMFVMPQFKIIVFSTSQRISKLFLVLTVRILTDLIYYANVPHKKFFVSNVEQLEYVNPDGYHNILYSLPSSIAVDCFLLFVTERMLKSVNFQFTDLNSTSEAALKADHILQNYEEDLISLVWGPNATDSQFSRPPTGFAFEIKKTAPLNSSIFTVENFFSGTSAIKLTDLKLKTGGVIDEEYIWTHKDTIRQKFLQLIPDRHKNEVSLKAKQDGTLMDKEEWVPTLGNEQAFIGLYNSATAIGNTLKRDLWLVVSSNQPKLSEEIYMAIETEEEKAKKGKPVTWEEFFEKDSSKIVQWAQLASKRNRTRLISIVLNFLDIDVSHLQKTDLYATANSTFRSFASPQYTMETMTNKVVPSKEQNSMVYYSQTIKTNSSDGVVFTHSPFIGISVLTCANNTTSVEKIGMSWEGKQHALHLFPVNTGFSFIPENKLSPESLTMIKKNNIFWKGSDKNGELPSVQKFNYKVRNEEFKQREKKLGYSSKWTEYNLIPLLVKLSTNTEN